MFLENEFYLMNKDDKLLNFTCDDSPLGVSFEEKESYSEIRPYGYEGIGQWISQRQAPKHRQYIADLLRMCGCYNLDGFIRVTHALSLNDTFWIKPISSKLQWNDVSLYKNQFDETIAKIAFEGGLYGKEFTTTSPEFGTSGSFAKCWVKDKDGIYLLKRGSEGARNAGLEPYSEMYASQIANIICRDSVCYTVEKYHNKLASKCKLFTSEQEGYVPITKFFDKLVSVKDILNTFMKYDSEEDFRRMIILDALILNTDRHMGNYGFIVDNDTMKIKRMAPMFDHNQSLLPYAEKDDFENLDMYLASRPTQIGDDFNEIAHALLTDDIKADLKNLRGFQFEQNGEYNLPQQRLECLNKVLDRQIDGILECKRLYIPSAEYTNKKTQEKLVSINEDRESIEETAYLTSIPGMDELIIEGGNTDISECLDELKVEW